MQKQECYFTPHISFAALTPKMLIGQKKPDIIYEKAFFSSEEGTYSEYTQNTSCWD